MLITFKNKRLEKSFNDEKKLSKDYGRLAKKIALRMSVLRAASNLSLIPHTPPTRRHALSNDRHGQWAVDLDGNNRLVFKPLVENEEEINLEEVTAIEIIEVTDYH